MKNGFFSDSRLHRIHVGGKKNGLPGKRALQKSIYISCIAAVMSACVILFLFKPQSSQFFFQKIGHPAFTEAYGVQLRKPGKLF